MKIDDLKLVHYSAKPLGKLVTRAPEDQREPGPGVMKPRGLWVSVEGEYDWYWWATEEHFQLQNLAVATDVILRRDVKVLHLQDEGAIRRFAQRYGATYRYPGGKLDHHYIEWAAVARAFQGIIIAPYCWELRLEPGFLWYYGWDCASGCIWDVSAIAEVRQRSTHTVPEGAS